MNKRSTVSSDAEELIPSSYAPAWTVKSKKYRKKFKKFQIFFGRNIDKSSKCLQKFAVKMTFLEGMAKKKQKQYSEKATFKSILKHWICFFLPRLTGMWFHDEFLQALRTFVNVSLKKIWNFLNFLNFLILLFMREHMSSGAEWTFRSIVALFDK